MDDARNAMAATDRAAEANAEFRPVTIEGQIVTRPASAESEIVHGFLRHLRGKGLECVPEPIGILGDLEQQTFIDGADGGDGWYHQHTDQGLASAARLLRAIHDAGRDWVPPAHALWEAPVVDGEDVVSCHGDPGPWNFIWRDQEAVGLIDWDYLHPATRLDDVAYALQWFAPLRRDEFALDWHHFPAVPDRRHRVRVFLEAYGDLPDFDLVDVVTTRMQATIDLERSLAEEGQEPQATWVADGSLFRREAELAWVREHGTEFT